MKDANRWALSIEIGGDEGCKSVGIKPGIIYPTLLVALRRKFTSLAEVHVFQFVNISSLFQYHLGYSIMF